LFRDRGLFATLEKGKSMHVEDGDTVWVGLEPHEAARPMKVVVDKSGCTWLCDADADEGKDLSEQGCWNCKDVAFTRND
jgi:streptogramin lyase